MITRPLRVVLALLLAAPGLAQAPSQPPSQPAAAPAGGGEAGEITVTGQREKEIRATAAAFVRAVLPPPRAGQFARWNMAICPQVNGLDAVLALRVAEKIRRVAADAGAKVARGKCRPNIIVGFTADAAGVATRTLARQADAALLIDSGDREALRTAPLPVRWWNAWRIEDESGNPATASNTALLTAVGTQSAFGVGEAPFQSPTGPEAVFTDGYSSSLVSSHQRTSLTAVAVLVDVDLSTGYSLDAVAAHVAMAALSQAPVRGRIDPALSILGLFRVPAGDGPGDLTVWDRALLKGLYKVPANRPARRQAGAILDAVVSARLSGE